MVQQTWKKNLSREHKNKQDTVIPVPDEEEKNLREWKYSFRNESLRSGVHLAEPNCKGNRRKFPQLTLMFEFGKNAHLLSV